jgi:hypothetical protein
MMPPHSVGGQDPVTIEIRIESFLREPRKLLVETGFTWPKPRTVGKDGRFESRPFMEMVEQYAAGEVWNFIAPGGKSGS